MNVMEYDHYSIHPQTSDVRPFQTSPELTQEAREALTNICKSEIRKFI
jgi:hypothetical protein